MRDEKKRCILSKIGSIDNGDEGVVIQLDKAYKRALLGLGQFSHGLIIYEAEDEMQPFELQLVQINRVDEKRGRVQVDPFEHIAGSRWLYDLKPYFPCEECMQKDERESALEAERHIAGGSRAQVTGSLLSKDEEEKSVSCQPIGSIKKQGKQYMLQLKPKEMQEAMSVLGVYTYVRVFWWFDRFDKEKYRKAVTCQPPYEHAPETGIFASRSPVRPNPIAVTTCRVKEIKGEKIIIEGMDCFDDTPLIGLMGYNWEEDAIVQCRVPDYLAHWPKYKEIEQDQEGSITELEPSAFTKLAAFLPHETHIIIKQQEINDIAPEAIKIKGARQNNLKNVSVTIPYHKLTVVTGVSGSGKSSLVFDTLFAESQRRWLGHMSSMQRSSFEQLERPDVDEMQGLLPAIAISQKHIQRHPRSTVGTLTEINEYLKQLFTLIGSRHCPKCGNAINTMTADEMLELLSLVENKCLVTIRAYGSQKILYGAMEHNHSLYEAIKEGLKQGKGAIEAAVGESKIILQTTQMCYHCQHLMFELTPSVFSFNQPESMCPECKGLGVKMIIDPEKIITDPKLSLLDGASSWLGSLKKFLENPNANWAKGEVVALAEKMKVDLAVPWEKLPEAFKKAVIWGTEEKVTFRYHNKNGRSGEITRAVLGAYHGIQHYLEEGTGGVGTQKLMDTFMTSCTCPVCQGERLSSEGRSVTVAGKRYPEVLKMNLEQLESWLETLNGVLLEKEWLRIEETMAQLQAAIRLYKEAGLGYLSLDRKTPTLSGGELQRIKLAKQLQSQMCHALYILDEPSMGLSSKDTQKIICLMRRLAVSQNTVVAVEHNRQIIEQADYVIDIGPKAGREGGQLMAAGTVEEIKANPHSLTGCYLSHGKEVCLPKRAIDKNKSFEIWGANAHNLKNLHIIVPYAALTCITGVSGAGKSSLLHEVIKKAAMQKEKAVTSGEKCWQEDKGLDVFDQVIEVGQQPIGKSPRSNPITYIGGMDEIRRLFGSTESARDRKVTAAMFSFNNKEGCCDHCSGLGKVDLSSALMSDTWVQCPVCKGKRYKKEVLQVTYQGKNIDEVLQMTVSEAALFFKDSPKLKGLLDLLQEVGLGYLQLGQSAVSLSGGEAQRIKLAKELGKAEKSNILYLLDEPSTGLHFEDMQHLLMVLRKLTEEGNTVVMIEHQEDMIKNCDWQIELGPEGGDKGGRLIKQGMIENNF